ncbi:hypothetical protein ACJX0J_015476, partial [Zea mays]
FLNIEKEGVFLEGEDEKCHFIFKEGLRRLCEWGLWGLGLGLWFFPEYDTFGYLWLLNFSNVIYLTCGCIWLWMMNGMHIYVCEFCENMYCIWEIDYNRGILALEGRDILLFIFNCLVSLRQGLAHLVYGRPR